MLPAPKIRNEKDPDFGRLPDYKFHPANRSDYLPLPSRLGFGL